MGTGSLDIAGRSVAAKSHDSPRTRLCLPLPPRPPPPSLRHVLQDHHLRRAQGPLHQGQHLPPHPRQGCVPTFQPISVRAFILTSHCQSTTSPSSSTRYVVSLPCRKFETSGTDTVDLSTLAETRSSWLRAVRLSVLFPIVFSDMSPFVGKDATEAFEDVGHSDEARALLPDMFVGDFEQGGVRVRLMLYCCTV